MSENNGNYAEFFIRNGSMSADYDGKGFTSFSPVFPPIDTISDELRKHYLDQKMILERAGLLAIEYDSLTNMAVDRYHHGNRKKNAQRIRRSQKRIRRKEFSKRKQ